MNGSPVWPEMQNVGAILGVGTANFKKGNKPLTRDNCLFKFLIAESVMLIWTIRLDKYNDKPMPTREEIRAKLLKWNMVRYYSDLKPNVLTRNCIRSLRSQDLCK